MARFDFGEWSLLICGLQNRNQGARMHDQTDRIELSDDEILACSVSDDLLEAAGGRDRAAVSLISTADRCIVC